MTNITPPPSEHSRDNCLFYPACYIAGDCSKDDWATSKCGLPNSPPPSEDHVVEVTQDDREAAADGMAHMGFPPEVCRAMREGRNDYSGFLKTMVRHRLAATAGVAAENERLRAALQEIAQGYAMRRTTADSGLNPITHTVDTMREAARAAIKGARV